MNDPYCNNDNKYLSGLADSIAPLLTPDARRLYDITSYSMISSTNTVLKSLAHEGAAEGTVLVSEAQSAGRGRMGRAFHSPSDSGLYMSVLLRPEMSVRDATQITTMAAVAGARAAEKISASANAVKIKWVNDLFLRGKKIAGILTEAELLPGTGRLSYAVAGIGFNLYSPPAGWPDGLDGIAGSIFGRPSDKAEIDPRPTLAAAFLNELYSLYKKLPSRGYIAEYRRRMLVLGKKVQVLQDQELLYEALALDVNDDCDLVVLPVGSETPLTLNSGEVRVKL